MSFRLKEIKKDQLVDFLLNPFDNCAKLGLDIIQKYKMSEKIDDILIISKKRGDVQNIGIICYDTKEVIFWPTHPFGADCYDPKYFKTKKDANQKVLDIINKRLDRYKINYLKQLKDSDDYKKMHRKVRQQYLKPIIFKELGTTLVHFKTNFPTKLKTDMFLDHLRIDDLVAILAGKMDRVDWLISEISQSEEFLEEQIIRPQIEKEAKIYIENGIFTNREQTLINFLLKTKLSGVYMVVINTKSGKILNCHNQVNCFGKMFSLDGLTEWVDIEDIETVTYEGNLLYKKGVI